MLSAEASEIGLLSATQCPFPKNAYPLAKASKTPTSCLGNLA